MTQRHMPPGRFKNISNNLIDIAFHCLFMCVPCPAAGGAPKAVETAVDGT